jgi:hypothetical protein
MLRGDGSTNTSSSFLIWMESFCFIGQRSKNVDIVRGLCSSRRDHETHGMSSRWAKVMLRTVGPAVG